MHQVPLTPVFVETIPSKLEAGKLYISEEFETASHLCAFGCGQLTVTPFKVPFGWELVKNGPLVSIIGSIGNFQFPCRSHYTITNNIATFI